MGSWKETRYYLNSEYDVAEKCVIMTPRVAASYGVPELVYDVPESVVRSGRISADTVDEYVAFYQGILDGKPTGEAVFRSMTATGWRWQRADEALYQAKRAGKSQFKFWQENNTQDKLPGEEGIQ